MADNSATEAIGKRRVRLTRVIFWLGVIILVWVTFGTNISNLPNADPAGIDQRAGAFYRVLGMVSAAFLLICFVLSRLKAGVMTKTGLTKTPAGSIITIAVALVALILAFNLMF